MMCIYTVVKVYNVYDVPVKLLAFNFEQGIETLSKILSIIGQKKELPERKIGENEAKETTMAYSSYILHLVYYVQYLLLITHTCLPTVW